MDYKISRFFKTDDEKNTTFFFKLNDSWWSRFYEYTWASKFSFSDDVCLDAACGISHPFKFYLADNCKEVYALDIDDRILVKDEIIKDVINDFGYAESQKIKDKKYFESIKYVKSLLTDIPVHDKSFDKVYCLSVLEHINEWRGKLSFLNAIPWIKRIKPDSFFKTLKEFKRVLKDDGLIILTFDYPNIDLRNLEKLMSKCGLRFAAESDVNIPVDVLSSPDASLKCFRAVLKKIV